MAVELATGYVTLLPSARGFQSAIEKEISGDVRRAGEKAGDDTASSFGKTFSTGIKGVAKAAAVGFAAALTGAVVLGKGAIDAASGLEEAQSKVNVVFGESAGAVTEWSKSASKAFGQSKRSALEAAGTYGNLFQAFGIGQQPAQEMSQTLVQLAADLASFNNTSVDEAIEALRSGLSGETEPLKRYGVAINETRLKAEAMRMGIVENTVDQQKFSKAQETAQKATRKVAEALKEHGKGSREYKDAVRDQEQAEAALAKVMEGKASDLNEAQKAQAAYSLIMQDTSLAQGDFERTSGGLANQQRILAARFEDAKASIGEALLPAMTGVVSFIADTMIPKIQDLAEVVLPALRSGFEAVAGWVMDRWPAVRDAVVGVFDGIREAVDYFIVGFTGMGTNEGEGFLLFANQLGERAGEVKRVVVAAFKAVVDWVKDHWGDIKDTFADVLDIFGNVVSFVVDNKPVLIGVLTAIGLHFVAMGVQAAAAGLAAAAAWIAAAAVPLLIGAAIAAVVAGFIYLYTEFDNFRAVVDAVVAGAIAAGVWLYEAWNKYADDIGNVLHDIGVVTYNIFVGIVDVIRTTVEVISAIVRGGIATWNALWPEISFVAEVVHGAFDMTVEIIKGAITMITALIEGAIMVWKVIWATVRFLYDVIHGAVDMVIEIVRGMIDTVRRTIEVGVATVQTTWAAIVGIFHFFRDQVYSPLVGAVSTLVTTITDLFNLAVFGARLAWSGLAAIYTFFRDNVYTPVGGLVSALGNFIIDVFRGVVTGVQTVWNGIKAVVGAPINVAIGFYNNGIKRIWDAVAGWVGLGSLPTISPVAFASGGTVPGIGNRDTVRAMLTPGEFVIQKSAAQAWPDELLAFLNDPRNAKGQTVDPGIFGYAAGGPVYRSGEDVLNFAKQQVGKPYSYTAGGSGNADCSYLWSVLVNYALGAANPYTRRFSTGTIQGDRALAPGLTDLATGMNMGVRPPYQVNKAGQFVGHMAGTLMGVNFESTPPATRMSPTARGAVGFPVNYNLPGFGGPTAVEQAGADQMVALHSAQMAAQPGPWGDLFTRIINQLPGKLFDFLMTKLPGVIVDAVTSAIGSVVSFLNPFSHFENGGRITRDGPILAGEKRPEILWGSRGEYMQAQLTGAGGGGPLIHIDGNLYGDDALRRVVREEVADLDFKRRASSPAYAGA